MLRRLISVLRSQAIPNAPSDLNVLSCVKFHMISNFHFFLFFFLKFCAKKNNIVELSPAESLSNSSECLTGLDDSDLTKHDTIINATINNSSQLTDQSTHHQPIMSLKDYLHTLDRHKSIDNCFLSPSSVERLYLFDEIKKITNHLFDQTIQAEPYTNGDDEKHENRASNNRVHDMNIQNLNTTQTTSDDTTTEADTLKESVKTCDESLDVNNNKINDVEETTAKENGESSERSRPFSEIFRKFASLADTGLHVSELPSAPWPISTKRTKFRINQMSSRDVPIFKTEKPAKLQKQKAVDACDTKLFDEQINHKSIFHNTPSSPLAKNCIADLLESFEHDRNQLFKSHFRQKFTDQMPNGSISFDCGQLGDEHRSMNTIRSLFQLHASTGRNVKQIQAQIEAKNK